MAGSRNPHTHPQPSALERSAFALASLLALAALALAMLAPELLGARGLLLLSGASHALSLALWLIRPLAPSVLLLFLPALPLAFSVLAREGEAAGAIALASTACAFQARLLLLALARRDQKARETMAAGVAALLPAKGALFVDNDIMVGEAKVEDIREGHLLRVESGERLPADGMVTFGSGLVDESLTGAPGSPRMMGVGSAAHAGTLQTSGSLLVKASGPASTSFARRLASRLQAGSEVPLGKLLLADCGLFVLALSALAASGPAPALGLLLLGSGALCTAFLSRFELGLAEVSLARRWLWRPGGLARLARGGMLVLRAPGILLEGRPRLAALETVAPLSRDAALSLLGPLARQLESPAAFALLRELRTRNIPLRQPEFPVLPGENPSSLVDGEELRWVPLPSPLFEPASLGALSAFVAEHLGAGDEVILLEREGKPAAAAAFRDSVVAGLGPALALLEARSLPALLLSPLPRASAHRLGAQLGLDHVQGESGDSEANELVARLAREGLRPIWARTGPHLPPGAAALVAAPPYGEGADLEAANITLPNLAPALDFARFSLFRLRCGLAWILGTELALAGLLLSSLARGGQASALPLLAVLGLLPGALALPWARPGPPETCEENARQEPPA